MISNNSVGIISFFSIISNYKYCNIIYVLLYIIVNIVLFYFYILSLDVVLFDNGTHIIFNL